MSNQRLDKAGKIHSKLNFARFVIVIILNNSFNWLCVISVKYQNKLGIDNQLRIQTGSDVNYFLADHLGSTNGLADSSGNLSSSASYDSFGNATGNLNTRYQFTGREYDSISKLHYYRARFYDGKLGRFILEAGT